MREPDHGSDSKVTPEFVRKDMQEFLAGPYGRPGPGRFSSDAMPIVVQEIISAENVDLRTTLRMCSYLVDIEQISGFNYLMGKDWLAIKGPSPSNLRKKILKKLQDGLSDQSASKDLDSTITLFSWVRHHKFRDQHSDIIKTKFPQRIKYRTANEEDMLRKKMKPEKALAYIGKAVYEELKNLGETNDRQKLT